MKGLRGKAALVLGGTRGIGAAIGSRLALEGASVTAVHLTRSDEVARFAAGIDEAGGKLLLIQADTLSIFAPFPGARKAAQMARIRPIA
jgi:3-oxoacyl-[acyl-carrier protein] reductase